MLSSVLFSLPLLVASAVASPTWGQWHGNGNNGNGKGACLNDATVNTLIDGYTYLLRYPQGQDFNSTANALLSDSFFVSSDSINTLAGIPLGVNAYPSKQAFIAGQAQTPAIPQLATLGYFYDCDQIAWRWNGSSIGSNKYEVKGIITMDVDVTTSKINAVYSEFNSGAWLADIGNPECQQQA
ncbi:hypothetical protein OHC33_005590 [Knufia fluminis]|uniref:NTF2-like domain-containing protein n=1 Tax=Knufia fluminis TaxID=191047 RepID=A0AAN8I7Q9_9EURO|nr:hypothetical protein OHC33_005590 [Knufia fluminis]